MVRYLRGRKKGNDYYSVGHGIHPYFLWIYDKWVRSSPLIQPPPPARPTHDTIWGEDHSNRVFKGRYEPDTGLLSIAKPPSYKKPGNLDTLIEMDVLPALEIFYKTKIDPDKITIC